jgi:uncharacterized protein
MSKIDALVQDFLAQKTIAVVGVSSKRETGCNSNYVKFKSSGYKVYAINPHINSFQGDPCYPDLRSVPDKVDAVFILANPRITDQIVKECVELGIKHVWMHCQMGVRPGLAPANTSVSQAAVEKARASGITVIPGSCPAQFLKPDIGHGVMRRLWTWLGYLSLEGAKS